MPTLNIDIEGSHTFRLNNFVRNNNLRIESFKADLLYIFSELKERLKKFYKREYSSIPYAPTLPDRDIEFHNLYVEQSLVQKDFREKDSDKGIKVTTYKEIFTKNEKKVRNVVIVGEAGSGKSSFLQNLVLQWSNDCETDQEKRELYSDKPVLKDFEFLFYIPLRDSCNRCNNFEMICDQLLRNIYIKNDFGNACELVEEMLDSASCLVLLDGLDEWAHPDGPCKCSSSDRGKTPMFHQNNCATVLITSRPWRLSQTPIKESTVDVYLEMESLENNKQLGENLVRILNGNSGTRSFSQFEEYLKHKVMDSFLLKTPVIFLQIVCLWYDGYKLSNSITIIYASIIDMLIGRRPGYSVSASQPHASAHCFPLLNQFGNISTNWNVFEAISKLAFDISFPVNGHSLVVFDCKALNVNNDLKIFGVICGILTENRSKSVSYQSSHMSFVHKSWQGFMSAIYICKEENLCDLETRLGNNMENLIEVFRFVCAMNTQVGEKLSEIISKCCNDMDEAKESKLEKTFRKMFVSDSKENMHPDAYLTDLMACGMRESDCVGNKDIHLTLQTINICKPEESNIELYKRLLVKNKNFTTTIKLTHGTCSIDSLISVLECTTNLNEIYINNTDVSDISLQLPKYITKVKLDSVTTRKQLSLHELPRLQEVGLWNVTLNDLPIKFPQTVTKLVVSNVKSSQQAASELSLLELPRLQEVLLKNMALDNLPIMLPHAVTKLVISNVKSSQQTASELSLHELPLLREVQLQNMALDNFHIKLSHTVTTLVLVNVISSKQAASELSLHELPRLQEVRLCNMALAYLPIKLPHTVSKLVLFNVQSSKQAASELSLHELPLLQEVWLHDIALDNFPIKLPHTVTTLRLNNVKSSQQAASELSLHDLPHLQEVLLKNMALDNLSIKLPHTVTKLVLFKVQSSKQAASELSLHELPLLQEVWLHDMALDNFPIKLPHTVTKLVLKRIKSSKQTIFPELQQLQNIRLIEMNTDDVSLKFPNSVTDLTLKSTCMSVAHLLGLVGELEQMPKIAAFELVKCKLSPMNEIGQIEQRIKSSPCFRLDNSIVLDADSSISLKCSRLGKIMKLIKGLKILKSVKQ